HRRLGILLAAHGKSGKAERRFEAGVCLKTRARSSGRGFSPACYAPIGEQLVGTPATAAAR
ncbi:hypothetical protein LGM31_19580, partial [Burkholderia vietnamiensis]|nr:hypothetical protein [Burkholderia vietnamiensis]